jgi:hypothetical protein
VVDDYIFALQGKVHVWKWFDDRTGRWCTYASSNNKTIDDSYMNGDTTVRYALPLVYRSEPPFPIISNKKQQYVQIL